MISKGVAESRYQLALKLFVSRNFEKSFKVISQLYTEIVTELKQLKQRLHLPIILVSNTIKLYLTEAGTIFDSDDVAIEKREKREILASLKDDSLYSQIQDLYEDQYLQEVPCDVWYTLLSAQFILRRRLYDTQQQSTEIVGKFQTVLDRVHSSPSDASLKKLVDLFVFQVLPAFDMFDHAELVITQHPVYVNKISDSKTRLDKIRQKQRMKAEEEKKLELERKKLEQEIKAKELLRKKELEKDRLLKNRTIKDINSAYQKDSSLAERKSGASSSSSSSSNLLVIRLGQLRLRIAYLASISLNFVKENSIIILTAILIAFLTSKFVNLKKINLKQKFSETIKMAFKVTYL